MTTYILRVLALCAVLFGLAVLFPTVVRSNKTPAGKAIPQLAADRWGRV